jgi:hypothetical protein
MTAIPAGLSVAAAALEGLIPPVVFRQRLLGVFVADVTVQEHHVDELAITEHPVEQGAAVTDHSFKRPARLTVTAGWTDSTPAGNQNRVQAIYAGLLALQATRLPFVVLTGKRAYRNMLFASLSVTTDEKSENALALVAELQEVIIVTTQVLTVPTADVQKTPQLNAATTNAGTKALASGANANLTGASKVLEITVTKGLATPGS